MNKNTLVFIYNSFNDPLFQNLMLSYIKAIADNEVGEFHMITFEQPRYALTKEQKLEAKKELARQNIYWHPLTFHTGRFLLLKKFWDLQMSLLLVTWIRIQHKTKIIFCFANVAASFGLILSRLLRMKLMVYSYEPHSEFMAELGFWSRKSIKYRILNWLEWQAGIRADIIMTGTQHMVDELARRKSKAQLFRAPTAVDPDQFIYNPDDRNRIRTKLGINESQTAFIYVGKFGDLYYRQEIPLLFSKIKQHLNEAVFVVVTSNDQTEINEMFRKYLIADDYRITGNLSYPELKSYLSAADVGISGVPPSPAQKYRSPTKVAEYMLMGLPYITTAGVSEDDTIASENRVGLVLNSFSEALPTYFLDELEAMIKEPKNEQRKRIRKVGMEYRSRERIVNILREIYEK